MSEHGLVMNLVSKIPAGSIRQTGLESAPVIPSIHQARCWVHSGATIRTRNQRMVRRRRLVPPTHSLRRAVVVVPNNWICRENRKSCTSKSLWNHGPLQTARDGCTCPVLMETIRCHGSINAVTRSCLTRFARVFSVDVTGRREASIGHRKDYGTVLVDVRG
jgi:hypothetical protein